MNKKNMQQTEQTERQPRIRSAAYRWALERLDEAVMRAEQVQSERLRQLEWMEQGWAIERIRERLYGTEIARAAK